VSIFEVFAVADHVASQCFACDLYLTRAFLCLFCSGRRLRAAVQELFLVPVAIAIAMWLVFIEVQF
jgi:hypothetical protein